MVVLFDTNYTHPTVYTDFCYQKSITAEYHRSLLRPVYGWFARIIAQLDHYFNRSFCEYKPLDKLELVIFKRGFNSLRFSYMMKGTGLTEFGIGTPRPQLNVSATLHHSAFDLASWDRVLLPFYAPI